MQLHLEKKWLHVLDIAFVCKDRRALEVGRAHDARRGAHQEGRVKDSPSQSKIPRVERGGDFDNLRFWF